ncbi:hypothetical protein D7X33_07315 [Butyricicoccus sp. 1XD8-22]|nr:hypothetical protein D7X33_07315 [Butyricicoccus sp. 1XD8-22]
MATKYDEVYRKFLSRISDYDFLEFDVSTQYAIMHDYLTSAAADFNDVCRVDLDDRDELILQFNTDLTKKEVEILAVGMVCYWLEPKVLSTDNLRNALNTKDYTVFSPSKLFEQIQNAYHTASQQFRFLKNMYSYRNGDLRTFSDMQG